MTPYDVITGNTGTMSDPQELEREIDQLYLAEVRYELQWHLRQSLLDWSRQFGEKFQKAVYSAAINGAWDDVRNDLRRGRISLDEADMLVDRFFSLKLINATQMNWYKKQFLEITEASL